MDYLRHDLKDKSMMTWDSSFPWRIGHGRNNNIWIDSEENISENHAEIVYDNNSNTKLGFRNLSADQYS